VTDGAADRRHLVDDSPCLVARGDGVLELDDSLFHLPLRELERPVAQPVLHVVQTQPHRLPELVELGRHLGADEGEQCGNQTETQQHRRGRSERPGQSDALHEIDGRDRQGR
jgi:hypothetical protein